MVCRRTEAQGRPQKVSKKAHDCKDRQNRDPQERCGVLGVCFGLVHDALGYRGVLALNATPALMCTERFLGVSGLGFG